MWLELGMLLTGMGLYRGLVLVARYYRRRLPPTEMHVERYQNVADSRAYARKHPTMWLMHVPSDHVKNFVDLPNPKGLHVHLAPPFEIDAVSLQKQRDELEKAAALLPFETHDVTFGWWSFNEDSLQVCKELGLTNIHVLDYMHRKIKLVKQHGLTPIIVKRGRYIHDYNL